MQAHPQSFASSTMQPWQQQILNAMQKQENYLNSPEGVTAFVGAVGTPEQKFGNALREAVPAWASNNMLTNLPERFAQSAENPNRLLDIGKSLIPKVDPIELIQTSARKLIAPKK